MVGSGWRGVRGEQLPAGRPFLRRRLRDVPDLRKEVEAARSVQQPRSVLLGRQLTSVTEYEYDDAGRLIRCATTHEAPWTDEDRDLLLALAEEERGECHGCGRLLTETADPANRGMYEVRRSTCDACVVLESEMDNDHSDGKRPRGVRYAIVKT